jgi:DUF4097 and DUF4098 domain-containing protein YvlB
MRNAARGCVFAALLGLAGCVDFGDFGDSERFHEDFHYSYPLTPGGRVSIENFNGSVEISGWEQNSVEVNGTKYGSEKSLLESIRIEVRSESGAVQIRTERPSEHFGSSGARYRLRVPRKAQLDAIVSTNGSLRIEDIEGMARLRTSNGAIRVSRIHGEVDARTTNGSIELSSVEGNVNVHTSNGSVHAEASHGSFEAVTSNGSIHASLTEPTNGWPVRLHTSNSRIDLRVNAAKLPDIKAETGNGSIEVHLPQAVNARLRASTTHSHISTDFDVTVQGGFRSDNELEGTIGQGGPLLELITHNGGIKVLRL